ncbi:MAG TPA: efflux RND transporter periplasmic adaptor subunit [Verrucomicrobiae bacterium]|nr:efflux RND transporter periplasmic adaptor subunit [Verrucomicrobiae bacterium]
MGSARKNLLLFCGLAMAMSLTGCHESSTASSTQPKTPQSVARSVSVATVSKRPTERTITVLGTLQAKQEVLLSAKVSGRLKVIQVDIGSAVKAGDVMARIEPRDYELQIQQAEAALAQTRARLGLPLEGTDDSADPEKVSSVKEARAVYEESSLNRERARNLDQAKLIPKSELDAAEAAYNVAYNRYQAALDEARQRQAALAERRAELEIARQKLADSAVKAPFDGVVQTRFVNTGAYLKEGDPVVALVQMNPLRLRLEVPEPQAARMRHGQQVRFSLTGEDTQRKTTIARINPALDKESHMLGVEADVENDGALHPGAFAQADIVVQNETQTLIIPPNAIRVFAGLQKVFVLEPGGRASKVLEKEITTGARGPDWVEVTGGLKEGDRVVLEPGGLRSGDTVSIPPATPTPSTLRSADVKDG